MFSPCFPTCQVCAFMLSIISQESSSQSCIDHTRIEFAIKGSLRHTPDVAFVLLDEVVGCIGAPTAEIMWL